MWVVLLGIRGGIDMETRVLLKEYFKDKIVKDKKCPYCDQVSLVLQRDVDYHTLRSYYWCTECGFAISSYLLDNPEHAEDALKVAVEWYNELLEKKKGLERSLGYVTDRLRRAGKKVLRSVVIDEL